MTRRVTLQLVSVALLGLGYLVLLATAPETVGGQIAYALQTVVMVGAAGLMARAARRATGRSAWVWWAAAGSSFASSLTFLIGLLYDLDGRTPPSPGPSDVPFFVSVALMLTAALLLSSGSRVSGDRARMVLDGAIVATSLLLISWGSILGPTVRSLDGLSLRGLVLVGYPLADVATATIVVIVLGRGMARRLTASLMAAGLLALAVADTVYSYLTIQGAWAIGNPVGVLWLVAFPLMAVAASVDAAAPSPSGDHGPERTTMTRLRTTILMAPAFAALVVTMAQNTDRSAVLVLGALVGLILLRQVTTINTELQMRERLERRVASQTDELRRQVFQDTVTRLGNRSLLQVRARDTMAGVDEAALLLLDLDGFKEINDTLGHAAGDLVLVEIGERLGAVTRVQDTVVRMGGDEFAVLLPGTGRQAAMAAADRVLAELSRPVRIGGTDTRVGGSVGVALASEGVEVDELLRRADLAMYEAKAAGGDQAKVFDTPMHARLSDRLRLESEVRQGVDEGQFTVYYQPLVDALTGEVVCLEALARWDHPQRGVVTPYEFLEVAERTGVIVELGDHVLRAACTQLMVWRQDWPDLRVAVNISHREVLTPDLADRVDGVLREIGLPAGALHLEVTETVLADDSEIRPTLDALVALGVTIAMDDFGTGHSSLSRIRDLPVSRLKIDRSFVTEITEGTAPLLESILALGRSLGMVTVAEGVETQAQLEFLTRHGCDELQGYLFSRPVPAEHVVPLLFSIRMREPNEPHTDDSPFPALVTSLMSAVVTEGGADDESVRGLLRELAEVAGLESVFLTSVVDGRQLVLVAHNGGGLAVREGLSTGWSETLCRRMIEDETRTLRTSAAVHPDLPLARDMGVDTYVSIPVRGVDGTVIGTLCGASSRDVEVGSRVIALMELFAGVLAGRVAEGASPVARARVSPAGGR